MAKTMEGHFREGFRGHTEQERNKSPGPLLHILNSSVVHHTGCLTARLEQLSGEMFPFD